jgi:hypothetical protein
MKEYDKMHIPKNKTHELLPKIEKIIREERPICAFCYGELGCVEREDFGDTIHLHCTCLNCEHEWSLTHLFRALESNPNHFKELRAKKLERAKEREEMARLDALELEELCDGIEDPKVIFSPDDDFPEMDNILYGDEN